MRRGINLFYLEKASMWYKLVLDFSVDSESAKVPVGVGTFKDVPSMRFCCYHIIKYQC